MFPDLRIAYDKLYDLYLRLCARTNGEGASCGRGETRLVPPLTAQEAAALNVCFLRDMAANIKSVSETEAASGLVVYTPTVRSPRLRVSYLQDSSCCPARYGSGPSSSAMPLTIF